MCFVVRIPTVQIAKKDIVCWKKLENVNGKFKSFYQGFVYKKDKLYKRNCLTKEKYEYDSHLFKGFHSYIFKNKIDDSIFHITKRVKFIIPKGARYLKNKNHNEYISNQIIMK